MIYKTHKDIYKRLASKLNLDESIIQTIGDFYYEDIKNRMESFSHREIYINKLGSIKFRKAESLRWMKNARNTERLLIAVGREEEKIKQIMDGIDQKSAKMMILVNEWDDIIKEHKEHKKNLDAYRDIQK